MEPVGSLETALDEMVPEILSATGAPGINVAVGVGEDVVLARGYGHAEVATRAPMTPDTVGPIGSDTKPYTALAALALVEAGHLSLDEPVNNHLGGLRLDNPHGQREITLRDLLTHRSGLGTTLGFCDFVPPPPLGEHLARVFAAGRSDVYGGDLFPLWSTPVGTTYQYANTGMAVVGYLVERANPEGLPFSAWVRSHVFEPLGMSSTHLPAAQNADNVPADVLARRSAGYATLPGLAVRLPQIYIGDYPAGTALSTPGDHCRFLLAMAGAGRLGGRRVLSAELARAMVSPQAPRGADPSASVGLVWNLFNHGTDDFYFGHGGEHMWGWNNVSRVWPGPRVAVTANTNQWDLGDNGTSDRPSHLAGLLLLGVVAAWVNGRDPRPTRHGADALGYMAGVLVADRLGPRLGMPGRLADADLAAVASGLSSGPGTSLDAGAFAEALREHASARGPAQIFAAVRGQVPDHQRELLQRRLGVPGLGRLLSMFDS